MDSKYNIDIKPLWLRKKHALELFEIGARKLDLWRKNGYIRSIKVDDGQRGTRMYYIPDIEDLLFKMAAGHKIPVKHGRFG